MGRTKVEDVLRHVQNASGLFDVYIGNRTVIASEPLFFWNLFSVGGPYACIHGCEYAK
jgi:hypothetical protein